MTAKEANPVPITSLTVFTFPTGARAWAFAQMGLARPLLVGAPGLRFYRLMGSGVGPAFSFRPNWSRYALLGVWEDEARARAFLDSSEFMGRYRAKAARSTTV